MEKALAMGKELGLTEEKLAEFIEKNEPKFAADIEREERRVERELKTKQMEMELQFKKDAEEQRLRHEVELEHLKLEALKLESGQRSHDSSALEMLSSVKPKPKIPFFDDTTDDMDSYLERFEWVAENCNWDKEDWPFHLSQYLRGKAMEAYTRLTKSDRKDYDLVKEALLRRYNLTEEGYRNSTTISGTTPKLS